MKKIKYQMLQTTIIDGVEQPKSEEYMASMTVPYSEENEEIAKREAYKGEYEIYDDGQPDPVETPSQLDRIEAQVAYNSMMLGTLIEEV